MNSDTLIMRIGAICVYLRSSAAKTS